MAKVITSATRSAHADHQKIRRPGVHAKSKHSNLKTSKHYVKAYRGQGR